MRTYDEQIIKVLRQKTMTSIKKKMELHKVLEKGVILEM